MNKIVRKPATHPLSLGDLIAAVSSCTRSPRERAAAINDMLVRGRVKIVPRRSHSRFAPS